MARLVTAGLAPALPRQHRNQYSRRHPGAKGGSMKGNYRTVQAAKTALLKHIDRDGAFVVQFDDGTLC